MPAGFANPVGGYLAFCTVKAIGYTSAAAVISRTYDDPAAKAFVVGPVRTLIGMATGAVLFAVLQISPEALKGLAVPGLIIVRLFEWWLLVWLFYDRHLLSPRHNGLVVFLGTVWSFVLDIPAALGFFIVGGFWVC
jgi:hypothetical protein